MFRTALHDVASGHGKSLAYLGSALALTGLGTATAAAATSSATPAPVIASATRHVSIGDDYGVQYGPTVSVAKSAAGQASAASATAARQTAVDHDTGNTTRHAGTGHATTGHATTGHASTPTASTPLATAPLATAPLATTPLATTPLSTTGHAAPAHKAAPRRRARARVHVVRRAQDPTTWKQVRDALAAQTYPKGAPGTLPLADRLQPGPVSGAQAYVPITGAQMANATTIVRQALSKHMGLRSAVIAVATSMQESTLQNLNYGDRDSLGLFQQRPSAGWGTPAQVTNPVYAADAFLNALHSHQQADPAWAAQPLWENAQAVQNSGFPYAYAKWEAQAAQLVSGIARNLA